MSALPGAVPPAVAGGAAAEAEGGVLDGEWLAAAVEAVGTAGVEIPSVVAVSADSCEISDWGLVVPVAKTGRRSRKAADTAARMPPTGPCARGAAAIAGRAAPGVGVAEEVRAARTGASVGGRCASAAAAAATFNPASAASAPSPLTTAATVVLPSAWPCMPAAAAAITASAASSAAAAAEAASTASVEADAGRDGARTIVGTPLEEATATAMDVCEPSVGATSATALIDTAGCWTESPMVECGGVDLPVLLLLAVFLRATGRRPR